MSTRDIILTAGVELLTDRGVDAVTVTDVAKRSGYSRQTLHAAFGDAACLRAAVCDHTREVGNERANKWLDLAGWPA
jgi:AcrR family transcriptional regulator